ncbi:MAG: hypothetical protein ACRC5F_05910, partial [Cetobacterium sp.]
ENDMTKLTIIPISLSKSKTTIESAKEVVDFYKGGNVIVETPSVIEIDVAGVNELVVFEENSNSIKDSIASSIISYLSTNYTGVIQKSKILSIIQNVLDQKASSNNFDLNVISVTYNFYNKNNYDIPVVISKIDSYKNIESNSVVTFGRLG